MARLVLLEVETAVTWTAVFLVVLVVEYVCSEWMNLGETTGRSHAVFELGECLYKAHIAVSFCGQVLCLLVFFWTKENTQRLMFHRVYLLVCLLYALLVALARLLRLW